MHFEWKNINSSEGQIEELSLLIQSFIRRVRLLLSTRRESYSGGAAIFKQCRRHRVFPFPCDRQDPFGEWCRRKRASIARRC